MKFDLRKPCKNCPFGNTPARIVFACRERAEEIEEHAYRRGFPCHLSAVLDEDAEDAGYEFGDNTQHCAGAVAMFLNGNYDTWPGIDNRELSEGYIRRLEKGGALAVAFDGPEAFLDANDGASPTDRRG